MIASWRLLVAEKRSSSSPKSPPHGKTLSFCNGPLCFTSSETVSYTHLDVYKRQGLFGVTYGQLNDRYDILNSDYLVMWGNNPAWAAFGNPSYYIKNFKQAGVKFVFVGPDYNASAGFTDAEWIPVRPGGDTALLLAVAYSMITRDEGGSLIDLSLIHI